MQLQETFHKLTHKIAFLLTPTRYFKYFLFWQLKNCLNLLKSKDFVLAFEMGKCTQFIDPSPGECTELRAPED